MYTFCAVALFVILYLVNQVYFNCVYFTVEYISHAPVAARYKA